MVMVYNTLKRKHKIKHINRIFKTKENITYCVIDVKVCTYNPTLIFFTNSSVLTLF